jgi:di/tripeptidase
MTERFEEAIDRANKEERATFTVRTVGVRPCGSDDVPRELHEKMIARTIEICKKHSGIDCVRRSGSTDCNSPMSMGVPAICLGCYMGGGAHTREEFVEIDSVEIGRRIAAELILGYY